MLKIDRFTFHPRPGKSVLNFGTGSCPIDLKPY